MIPRPARAMTIVQSLVGLLLVLNPALLIWQHFGMTRVVELSPRQPYGATVTDDRHENGHSVASLVRANDALVMRCDLRAGYAWPFCKLQFHLGQDGKGVDFSRFDSVTFDMRYAGESGRKITLHLTNFEPEFSTAGDWNSQRYNAVEFDAPAQATFTIPVYVVRTADWWFTAHNVQHGLRITSSFGLTSLKPEEDIGAAIKRADGALYRAKANGRNRVEIA